MTDQTIDHAAEARKRIEEAHRGIRAGDYGGHEAATLDYLEANAHATLALVEAQREANEIARIQTLLTLPAPPEELRETPVDDLGRERMERILKGLGLP